MVNAHLWPFLLDLIYTSQTNFGWNVCILDNFFTLDQVVEWVSTFREALAMILFDFDKAYT